MSDSPVTTHDPNADDTPAEASPQEQKKMEQAYAQMKRKMSMEEIGKKIKHKIMVLSGKGGVGKSTVSTGLALSLAQQGLSVGILDIDITGPNVPKMMGLDGQRLHVESGRIHPAKGHLGVKVISMAFYLIVKIHLLFGVDRLNSEQFSNLSVMSNGEISITS